MCFCQSFVRGQFKYQFLFILTYKYSNIRFIILPDIKMKINFCIFIVLFVYCISSVENNSGFDHFWLVLSWPPVYCLQIRCERKPTDFVLHGLWPVNSTGHSLKNSTNGTPNFYSMVLPLLFFFLKKKLGVSLLALFFKLFTPF